MTFNEARKILGLGPDEDPRPHVAEFQAARERIAEMVRNAPNDNLALRYQEGLIEFDKALAALREYLEALGLDASRARARRRSRRRRTRSCRWRYPAPPRNRSLSWIAWLLVFLTGATGGGLLYLKNEREQGAAAAGAHRVSGPAGHDFVENRRWQEAAASYCGNRESGSRIGACPERTSAASRPAWTRSRTSSSATGPGRRLPNWTPDGLTRPRPPRNACWKNFPPRPRPRRSSGGWGMPVPTNRARRRWRPRAACSTNASGKPRPMPRAGFSTGIRTTAMRRPF